MSTESELGRWKLEIYSMNKKLSPSMKKILLDAYRGNSVSNANKTQLKGLVSREYLNDDFEITSEGELYAFDLPPSIGQNLMRVLLG